MSMVRTGTQTLTSLGILDRRVQSTGGQNRFLAISVSGNERLVVGKPGTNVKQHPYWHDFIFESFKGFSGCEYEIWNLGLMMSKGEIGSFQLNLKQFFDPIMDDNGKANLRIIFKMSRRSIGHAIKLILEKVESEFHKQKIIHGDIKPHNCLTNSEGVFLIDSLQLKQGEISPAVSPFWGAPEQVALRPVTTATDIYPIGLMLVSLVKGQVTGEVLRYQLPSDQRNNSIVSVIRNPFVYLDTQKGIIQGEGLEPWMKFLEKCLRYDPRERYTSAAECASDLRWLLDNHPPNGSVELELQRGELQMARLPNGADAICRILRDSAYGNMPVPPYPIPVRPRLGYGSMSCPSCGTTNAPGAAWCDNCGSDFG